MIPIPGSSNAKRVKQNTEAADIKLSEEDLKEINRILDSFEIKGGRYPDHSSGLLVRFPRSYRARPLTGVDAVVYIYMSQQYVGEEVGVKSCMTEVSQYHCDNRRTTGNPS